MIYLSLNKKTMKAYFLNISEDEKKTIQEKHRELYNGYQTLSDSSKMTPLKVENLALDEKGITVNAEGDVTEYKNTGINKPMKKVCSECGEVYESETCECGNGNMYEDECNECGSSGMSYTMEDLEESINQKSKAKLIKEQVEESLKWFNKFKNY
jgi:hypothetical protein